METKRWLAVVGLIATLGSSAFARADMTAGAPEGGMTALTVQGTRALAVEYVITLVVDPRNSKTVYAGTLDGGVMKSSDEGRTWRAVNAGLTATRVDALAIDPRTSRVLYAGTGRGVFKSADGGRNWRAINAGLSGAMARDRLSHRLAEGFVYMLAVDAQAPKTLYAGTGGGLYKSTDGGRSWRASGLVKGYISSLAINPQNRLTLYAGVSGSSKRGGVFKSTDGGRRWQAADGGNRDLTPLYFGVSLVVDPQNPETVYAGSARHGVFKSTDGARSWRAVGLEKLPVGLLAIDPHVPQTMYAVTWLRGVFKSVDAGESWQPLPALKHASALAIDQQHPETVYAGTSSPGGVFRSTDGGSNWGPA